MRLQVVIAIALAVFPQIVGAAPQKGPGIYTECFKRAAKHYQVDVGLYMTIVEGESSFRPEAIHHNKDGSTDYGMAQINSSLFPALARYGISREDVINNVCLNIHLGAWVLHEAIRKYGYTWRAVGAYGAGWGKKRERARAVYANRVALRYYSKKQAVSKSSQELKGFDTPFNSTKKDDTPTLETSNTPKMKVY